MSATWVVEGTHRITRVVSVQDGDSLRVDTWQEQELALSDDFTTTVVQRNRDPRGLALRLVRLDTPELRAETQAERARAQVARTHAREWLERHAGRLMVTTYGSDDLSRKLADVWVVGDRGNTLTQHMLLMGWDPWLG